MMNPCNCGCGEDAGVYNKTRTARGHKKGDPKKFVNGHNTNTLTTEEQSRRGRKNDGSKLRYTGKKSYVKYKQRHLHRVVAELKLGRNLRKGEIVHHIDGNKRNNHPSNLEVLSNQGEHINMHRHDLMKGKLGGLAR